MKARSMKMSLRALIVLMSIAMLAQGVLAAAEAYDGWGKYMGSGIALGLAAIGAGYSQGSIGSAAVGMLAEDGSKFGPGSYLHCIARIYRDSRCTTTVPMSNTGYLRE